MRYPIKISKILNHAPKKDIKKAGNITTSCFLTFYINVCYSSSSKLIASRVVANTSYSSLLPTINFSNSF